MPTAAASQPQKRVLIIAYYWPPSGGGGVQRWLKFAKLLPNEGWEPIIVTPSNPDVPVEDPSLSDDVPKDLKVWAFPVMEPTRLLKKSGLAEAQPGWAQNDSSSARSSKH